MDLYLIGHICATVALVAFQAAVLLLWLDGRRDPRARERKAREALARALDAANKEVPRRPRVPDPSPLPTLERTQ